MERKIITYEDDPLLQVEDQFDGFNHMLRISDRKSVPILLEYLNDNGLDVYLGGDAVYDCMFNGQKSYNGISILGVGINERGRVDLINKLEDLSQYTWTPEELASAELQNETQKIMKMTGRMKIKNHEFNVANISPSLSTMCLQERIESRFKFFPKAGLFYRPSAIDVSIIDLPEFVK